MPRSLTGSSRATVPTTAGRPARPSDLAGPRAGLLARCGAHVDAVVDYADRVRSGKPSATMCSRGRSTRRTPGRCPGQQLVRQPALGRWSGVGEAAMLGEHEPEGRGPEPGQAAVDERGVVMAVKHSRAVPGGAARHGTPGARDGTRAGGSARRRRCPLTAVRPPGAGHVETADRHGDVGRADAGRSRGPAVRCRLDAGSRTTCRTVGATLPATASR